MKNEHDANLALQREALERCLLTVADQRAVESIRRHRAFRGAVVRVLLKAAALSAFAAIAALLIWGWA